MSSKIWGIIGGVALILTLLSPHILGSTKKVKEDFEAAEMLYEQGNHEEAIAKYEEALKKSNRLLVKTEVIDEDFITLVNFKIAMSYVRIAEQSNDRNRYYQKAIEHIEQAEPTAKNAEYRGNLTFLWGSVFYKAGHLEEAREKLTQFIKKFPNNSSVEEAQSILHKIKPPLPDPEWINDLSKFEAFHNKRNIKFVVPNRLRVQQEYAKAAEKYVTLVNSNLSYLSTTEAAYALYWSGWCYYQMALDNKLSCDKPRAAFQRLVDNYSGSPYSRKAREKLNEIKKLNEKKQCDKAISDAEEAVRRTEKSDCKSDLIFKATTHLDNAKEEREQDNYQEASQLAKDAEEIARKAFNNHEAAKRHVNQGSTYLNQGLLERAMLKARAALDIDPPYQNAKELLKKIGQKYFEQGRNYVEAEEYNKAIPLLKKAIAIDSRFKEAYYKLGRAHMKLGEFLEAKTAAKRALEIDPNYKAAQELCDSIVLDSIE